MSSNPLITASGSRDGAAKSLSPIATVFGVPFDSTHSFRPGCRFGADSIREAFNNIEIFHPDLHVDLDDSNMYIEDLGNTRHTVVASEMVKMVRNITTELVAKKRQLFILGGEHSITYPAYASFPKETGYVVFDAHYDLRDEFADSRLSHASYLRRIVEERGADNVLHVGARAFDSSEYQFLAEHRIKTITDKDIRDGLGPSLLEDHTSVFDSVYSSFDLDVLDPAYAPGVGNPEATGITSRELFDMIYSLSDTKVAGADIVELNPYCDNGSTASVAAKILSTLIALNISK